ncbi:hypothetical protein NPIL_96331 [Nephila pilipes]|uniref:Uncharacterized protein n=1 Tax=Nephila pilipes TaxID=299642 RepID=A0A8X6MMK0_NEPPI|nr:hypothetical protein NPIL_191911 [Nephila pilipes]GFS67818.1 hypothetical protein NPIL_161971 [Nephila pilipes]GFT80119.1 hypothetical protein NPIL_176081 [Nephila pilipes]GFU23987.1 hypothetical protein NPIL_96331 [Nephila pilipes]
MSSENYDEAIKLLNERFGKKKCNNVVEEKHCTTEIQNEFDEPVINNPSVEPDSRISIDNFRDTSKKKNNNEVQDVLKRIFNDVSMDSNDSANNTNESCPKTDFSHELEKVDNLMNQYEHNESVDNKGRKKKHKEKTCAMKN